MRDIPPIRVLFVCMGNICRSPTAHGVFQALVHQENLSSDIEVDSAGTHGFHIGNPPDLRSQAEAQRRGIDLSCQRARRLETSDLVEFDYIFAMDKANLANIRSLQTNVSTAQVELMLKYSSSPQLEVPDPYLDDEGFGHVFDLIDDAARGLLRHIRQTHRIG